MFVFVASPTKFVSVFLQWHMQKKNTIFMKQVDNKCVELKCYVSQHTSPQLNGFVVVPEISTLALCAYNSQHMLLFRLSLWLTARFFKIGTLSLCLLFVAVCYNFQSFLKWLVACIYSHWKALHHLFSTYWISVEMYRLPLANYVEEISLAACFFFFQLVIWFNMTNFYFLCCQYCIRCI